MRPLLMEDEEQDDTCSNFSGSESIHSVQSINLEQQHKNVQINLKPDWEIILSNVIFQRKYQAYIISNVQQQMILLHENEQKYFAYKQLPDTNIYRLAAQHDNMEKIFSKLTLEQPTHIQNTKQNESTCVERKSFEVTNKKVEFRLKPEWKLVVSHPQFQMEYKKYITNRTTETSGPEAYLNYEIEINDSCVLIQNESININKMEDRTNTFMGKFQFIKLIPLTSDQLNLLKEHSQNVVYERISNENAYNIATVDKSLIDKLTLEVNANNSKNHSPSLSKGLINGETIEYFVKSYAHLQFFNNSRFEADFKEYLNTTYKVKIIIRREESSQLHKDGRSAIIINITGHSNDIRSARDATETLFSSIQSKTYEEKD
ncbi:unnamed protein product, partial [Didymodactylos carnosus]